MLALLEESPQDVDVESRAGESVSTGAGHQSGIAMAHNHLPRLEDYGYVVWNEDAHEVVRGPRFEEVRPLLAWMATRADRADLAGQFTP